MQGYGACQRSNVESIKCHFYKWTQFIKKYEEKTIAYFRLCIVIISNTSFHSMAIEFFIQRYVQSRRMEGVTATISCMEYGDMYVFDLFCNYVSISESKSSSVVVYITFHLL